MRCRSGWPVCLAALMTVMLSPAVADPPPAVSGLPALGPARIASMEDGHSLRLADGRTLRLAGIIAPLPERDADLEGRGRADAARQALIAVAGDGVIQLYGAVVSPDRYGRLVAQAVTADGVWLQDALLRQGVVRLWPLHDDAQTLDALHTAEQAAREARRGLWRTWRYGVQDAASVTAPPGRFVIVRGRVLEAAKLGGTVYLNFGTDWRSDFTVQMDWPARRRLPQARRDADWWRGREIEARGVLERLNGPLIKLTVPGQIRVIEAASEAQADENADPIAVGRN